MTQQQHAAARAATRRPLSASRESPLVEEGRKDAWDPSQYLAYKETFQGQFAADYLTLPSASGATLSARLAAATRLLDVGSGDGSHTRRMAQLLPASSSATGVDLSPSMVAAAQAAAQAAPRATAREAATADTIVTKEASVAFVAADVATWGAEPAQRGQFDLATSFMALHWVPEADLPATLRGIRAALAPALLVGPSGGPSAKPKAHPAAVPLRSWFVASFHGDGSMPCLVDAVNATIDAAQLMKAAGGNESAAAAGAAAPATPAITSWGQVGAAVAAARWRHQFSNGRADWRPITMLPAARWVELLRDAGFDVDRGVVQVR